VADGQYRDEPPRADGTCVGFVELIGHFAVNADPTAVIDDLTDNHFPDVSWLVIQHRQQDIESESDRTDPSYHDPAMADGLRAPVSVAADRHTLSYSEIDAVVGGSEVSAAAGETAVDPPADDARADTLTIESDGAVVINGTGATVADIETHPAKIVDVEEDIFELPESEWATEEVRGSPPGYIEDAATPMPDPLPSDPVDRNEIPDSKQQEIYDLIEAHPDQDTADLAKGIVDIVFGNV
jgi:hypothetical protein